MFKASRWRGDKNKLKAVFRFQFQASQVPEQGWEALIISLVPLNVGRPSMKSEKAAVVNGSCQWTKPVYETVKLSQDPKSGKINDRVYQFIVSTTGSTKTGILGEATINLVDYAEVLKPSSVTLPLRPSNTGAILHVTLQRLKEEVEGREADENRDILGQRQRRTLMSQLSITEKVDETDLNLDERINTDSTKDGASLNDQVQPRFHSSRTPPQRTHSNIELRKSSSSDAISAVGSDTSSERYTPKASEFRDNQGPNTDWSSSSVVDGSTGGSTNSSGENGWRERLQDPDVTLEQLRSDAIALARQVEVSALELQTLRKQVVKESRRGQELLKELTNLKDERDALKKECDERKQNKFIRDVSSVKPKFNFEDEDPWSMLDEAKQELNHEKKITANLRLQLQKTQEANSELILAVRDLDELLEQKNKELSSCSCASRPVIPENNKASPGQVFKGHQEPHATYPQGDSEQYELEELVKGHVEATVYSVEKQIIELKSEVELYRKDREELEMQMEQLALDYEILKQENHDISSKLEQTQLREQLRIQYECSAHLAIINELEAQVDSLEKELETQAQAFESDLEAVVNQKVEQEQRAIQAEEALTMTRMKNAGTAEQLQNEFERLSAQISSMFHTNDKLTAEAITEANQLWLEKCHLEDLLHKANEGLASAQCQYHANLNELMHLVNEKTIFIDKLSCQVKNKQEELETLKQYEEKHKITVAEIEALEAAVEELSREKEYLSARLQDKELLTAELNKLRKAKETTTLLEEQISENCNLERELVSTKNDATRLYEQLNDVQLLKDEKEEALRTSNSEMKDLKLQNIELKEKLRSKVLDLKSEVPSSQGIMVTDMQIHLRDGNARHDITDGPINILKNNSLEAADSTKIIKPVEGILKDRGEENILKNEANMSKQFNCLQSSQVERINHSAETLNRDNAIDARDAEGVSSFSRDGDKSSLCHVNGTCKVQNIRNTRYITAKQLEAPNSYYSCQVKSAEVLTEMELLKERNQLVETELKDLQERYSAISLKFAEVEGERQQLVMTIRTLKNAMKS